MTKMADLLEHDRWIVQYMSTAEVVPMYPTNDWMHLSLLQLRLELVRPKTLNRLHIAA
jgi:hypothetical protein